MTDADKALGATPGETEHGTTQSGETVQTGGTAQSAGTAQSGKAVREEDRAPMGFSIRVFIYLVGVHFIAGFLFLLFYLGGAK